MFWWKNRFFQQMKSLNANQSVRSDDATEWSLLFRNVCVLLFCFSTFDNICLQLLQVSLYLHQPGTAYHMSVCTHLCPLQSVSSTLQQPPRCRCFVLLELEIFGPVCIIIISGVVIIDRHFRQKHSLNLLLVCNIQPQILEYLL